jgi:hypothetical protein
MGDPVNIIMSVIPRWSVRSCRVVVQWRRLTPCPTSGRGEVDAFPPARRTDNLFAAQDGFARMLKSPFCFTPLTVLRCLVVSFYCMMGLCTAWFLSLRTESMSGFHPARSAFTAALSRPMKSIEPAKRPKPCYTGRRSDVAIYMRHLRDLVVRPTLKALDPQIPYSQNAECLVMETIAHESGLGTYLSQYPYGPARGVAQIEESTFSWLKDLTSTRYQSIGTKLFQLFGEPEHDQLSARMDLSVAFCRFRYFIVKEPIPDTLEGRASYWARYYLTTNDSQKIKNYIDDARRYL